MNDRAFWLTATHIISLGLFVITLVDNLIDYSVHCNEDSLDKKHWYRSLLPSTAWLFLLALSAHSLLIQAVSDTARFWIFFAEASLCLGIALFLCWKTFGYWHNLVYIYAVAMALVILAARILLWDFLFQLAGSNPTVVIMGLGAAWITIIAAQVSFAVKRHGIDKLVSGNIIQIMLTNLWGVLMAVVWVFKPLLAP